MCVCVLKSIILSKFFMPFQVSVQNMVKGIQMQSNYPFVSPKERLFLCGPDPCNR